MITQPYTIKYPSGSKFVVDGFFSLTPIGDNLCPVIFDAGDKAVVLDQRAIVKDNRGKIVYQPRTNLDGLEPGIAKWLKEHEDWNSIGHGGHR